jgi:hypothetical protein
MPESYCTISGCELMRCKKSFAAARASGADAGLADATGQNFKIKPQGV